MDEIKIESEWDSNIDLNHKYVSTLVSMLRLNGVDFILTTA
ncbi:hypothetical protein M2105_000546 [Paenibacillus sp. PastF-1]|nr:hypothetical protein [Paenibacillus sp. PastF-3]MDF9839551.1 hypothetical protein [Paenibacillus sp. PastF-2]MDF9846132.1 hypothetical protein [Paenibacillus sp. PastM-2]MDF9852704.1 hypothetical protein [Paenibacillus sp. PastF-1]MDH6477566.1 hypothetical protein [Paenibacillus sp. PastH-2]MDH6373131.1 hypothetical protein [Paenibacillus sp. PastF-3]